MPGRPLTDGETAITREVFGDSIETERVRIHSRRWLPFVQPRDTGMAPLGHIYMHGTFWRDDYSEAALGMRAVFVHEMTHVWQWQTGVCIPLLAGAWQMIRTRGRYQLAYAYTPHSERDLLEYNLEQQARIVEDWYEGRRDDAMAAVLRRFHENPSYPLQR